VQSIIISGSKSDGLTKSQIARIEKMGKFIPREPGSNDRFHGGIIPHDGNLHRSSKIVLYSIGRKNDKLMGEGFKKFSENELITYIEQPIFGFENVKFIVERAKKPNNFTKIFFLLENCDLVIFSAKMQSVELIENYGRYKEVVTEFNSIDKCWFTNLRNDDV